MAVTDALSEEREEGAGPADRANAPEAGAIASAPTDRLRTDTRIWAIPVAPPEPRSLAERLAEAVYRGLEVALSAVLVVLTSPLLLLQAVLVRLDSPGPVLFVHQRCGRAVPTPGRELAGRDDLRPPAGGFEPDTLYWVPTTFPFVKFRTMYADSSERFPQFYWWNYDLDPEQAQKMFYKLEEDPRLTRVGRLLRKTTLDELPNLWSVVRGHTRLVGPRPEEPRVLNYYEPEQMEKFTVRPGITCLSKIYGRGNLSVGEQIAWDLEYVRTRSVGLDLKILFRTAWMVVLQRGSF